MEVMEVVSLVVEMLSMVVMNLTDWNLRLMVG
jgi:hypothetical protein